MKNENENREGAELNKYPNYPHAESCERKRGFIRLRHPDGHRMTEWAYSRSLLMCVDCEAVSEDGEHILGQEIAERIDMGQNSA